jgi:hypothetical protein
MVMQPLRPVPYALSTIEMSQHVWSISLQDESKRTSINNTPLVTDAGCVWSDTYWQIICTCTHCDGQTPIKPKELHTFLPGTSSDAEESD